MQFGKTGAPDFPKLAVQFCIDVRSHFGDHRVITLIDTQSKSIIDHTIWSPDKKIMVPGKPIPVSDRSEPVKLDGGPVRTVVTA